MGRGGGPQAPGRAGGDGSGSLLAEHPDGTVVALGEGLETQFWRVDNGRVRWLSVDLPEVVALRRRLLVTGPRQRLVACSGWGDDDPGGLPATAHALGDGPG